MATQESRNSESKAEENGHHHHRKYKSNPSHSAHVMDLKSTRILLLSDVEGNLSVINSLAKTSQADFVVCTGNIGLFDANSTESVSQEYLPPRAFSYNTGTSTGGVGELEKFLSGDLKFHIPVYAIYGAKSDIQVVNKFRTKEYEIENFHLIDEMSSHKIGDIRLFGVCGDIEEENLFNSGSGTVDSIAGHAGKMWLTMIQAGQLLSLAKKTAKEDETRLFLCNQTPTQNGLLAALAAEVKSDIVVFAAGQTACTPNFYPADVMSHQALIDVVESAASSIEEIWAEVQEPVTESASPEQLRLIAHAMKVLGRPAPSEFFKQTWHIGTSSVKRGGSSVLTVRGHVVGLESIHPGTNFQRRRTPALKPHMSLELRPDMVWDSPVTLNDVKKLLDQHEVTGVLLPKTPTDPIRVELASADSVQQVLESDLPEFKGTQVLSQPMKRQGRGRGGRGGRGRGGRGRGRGGRGRGGRGRRH